MNWRQAYHEHIEQEEKTLLDWRARARATGARREVQVGLDSFSVAELSDLKIREVARLKAARVMERAINQWNANEDRCRTKQGAAL